MIQQITAEEFLAFAEGHPDQRFDFIDGEMVEVSPKPLHGRIQTALILALGNYNQQHPSGVVYTETLHVLAGEKFIPDVALNIASDAAYLTTAPHIAVEIRSDTQSRASQRRKAEAYLRHGTRLVILVLPGEQVELYRPGQPVEVLAAADTLMIEDVLPGFRLPLASILA